MQILDDKISLCCINAILAATICYLQDTANVNSVGTLWEDRSYYI